MNLDQSLPADALVGPAKDWVRNAEAQVHGSQEIAGLVAGLVVQGRSGSGEVTVSVDAAGRVVDIQFEQAALRGGAGQVRVDVLDAYRRAVGAVSARVDQVAQQQGLDEGSRARAQHWVGMQHGLSGGPAPVNAQLRHDGGLQ